MLFKRSGVVTKHIGTASAGGEGGAGSGEAGGRGDSGGSNVKVRGERRKENRKENTCVHGCRARVGAILPVPCHTGRCHGPIGHSLPPRQPGASCPGPAATHTDLSQLPAPIVPQAPPTTTTNNNNNEPDRMNGSSPSPAASPHCPPSTTTATELPATGSALAPPGSPPARAPPATPFSSSLPLLLFLPPPLRLAWAGIYNPLPPLSPPPKPLPLPLNPSPSTPPPPPPPQPLHPSPSPPPPPTYRVQVESLQRGLHAGSQVGGRQAVPGHHLLAAQSLVLKQGGLHS